MCLTSSFTDFLKVSSNFRACMGGLRTSCRITVCRITHRFGVFMANFELQLYEKRETLEQVLYFEF